MLDDGNQILAFSEDRCGHCRLGNIIILEMWFDVRYGNRSEVFRGGSTLRLWRLVTSVWAII
jgi:hypothetical protein